MKKQIVTRIRILRASPTMYRGIVMHGAKMVASTANHSDSAVCARLASALESVYKVAQRAVAR